MARTSAAAAALTAMVAAARTASATAFATAPPRLILFIVADDVGYGDTGFTGGRGGRNGTSLTPRIDALAASGVVLDQHYTHFYCTPSRCSLLSGRLPMHVQQGQAFPETPSAGA